MRKIFFIIYMVLVMAGCKSPVANEQHVVLVEAIIRTGEPLSNVKISVSNLSDGHFEACDYADAVVVCNGRSVTLSASLSDEGYYSDAKQQLIIEPGDTIVLNIKVLDNEVDGRIIVPPSPAFLNLSHNRFKFSSADALLPEITFPASENKDLMMFVYRKSNSSVGKKLVHWGFVPGKTGSFFIGEKWFGKDGNYIICLAKISGMPEGWRKGMDLLKNSANLANVSWNNGFGYFFAVSSIEKNIEVTGLSEGCYE